MSDTSAPRGFLFRFMLLALASGIAIGMTKAGNVLLALHLGAEPWQANLIAAIEAAGMFVITIPAGFLIARFGPQPVYLISSVVAAAAYTASPWLTVWWHLLFVGLIVGVCIPFRVVSMSGSFLARLGTLGAGKSGWYRGSLMTGMWLIGPVVGGLLLDHFGVTILYAAVSLLFLAMGLGSQAVLPERISTPADGIPASLHPRHVLADTLALLRRDEVRRTCTIEFAGGLTGGFFATFAIIIALQVFHQSETGSVGPLAIQGGAFVITLFFGGQILGWLRPEDTWRLAQALVTAGLLSLGLAGTYTTLLVGSALLGAGLGFQHLANVHAIARSTVDKGRVSGVFTFAGTAGSLVGLLASGAVSHVVSLQAVFLLWIPIFLFITWNAVQTLPLTDRIRQWPSAALGVVRRAAGGIATTVAVLGLWEAATHFHWVPVHIVVPPDIVWGTLRDLAISGELWDNVHASLWRVGLGFLLGAHLGLAYGLLHGLWRPARTYTSLTFDVIRQVPTVGWIPLLILAVGIDEPFKIIVIGLGAFFPVALATIDGVAGVPRRYHEVADVLRFSPWLRITKVVLPAALPDIATGLRIALSRSWMLIVAAELFGADLGVGHLMDWGRQLFQMDLLLAALVVTAAVGFLIDRLITFLEARFLSWKRQATL